MRFKGLYYIAWTQAFLATVGSLYFSEVVEAQPCLLCWYQRILMYPLVVIIMVGIFRKDKGLPVYVLPFSVSGMILAFYQYLLQRGVFPEHLAPCSVGVSCFATYINWFGFVTIPFLSLVAFSVITVIMALLWKKKE